jgi:hypothetical protein
MMKTTEQEIEAPEDVETIGLGQEEKRTAETPEDLANLFDEGAGVAKPEDEAEALASFEFSQGGEAVEATEEPKPKRKYTRRRRMGPSVDPELEALFTEAGIGAVAASGLDGFFRVCAAPPMSDVEKRHMEKVVAYYAQQRMPKEASKYQPEILLGLMLSFIVIPRLGPISRTTGPVVRPFFSRVWGGIRRIFRRKQDAE